MTATTREEVDRIVYAELRAKLDEDPDAEFMDYARPMLVDARLALASSEAKLAEAERVIEMERKEHSANLQGLVADQIAEVRSLRSQLSSAEQTIAGYENQRKVDLRTAISQTFDYCEKYEDHKTLANNEDVDQVLAAYLKSKEGVPDKPKEGGK
jgi:hypothetical protein